MKKIIFVLFTLLHYHGQAQCPVIPTPSSYISTDGYFFLPETLQVNKGEMLSSTFEYLADELKLRSIEVISTNGKGDLQFEKTEKGIANGYEINVNESAIISINSAEGEFYAVNTLLQLIVKHDSKSAIKRCKIQDNPRFDWRGLHLDVSRHFFSVDEVKGFIDLMALYKFNTFHWHLTDDQGWRIEIKKYPKLTLIGGFRDSTVIGHFSDTPRKYDPIRYGGFYTQEDIKEVVAYAAERFIDVVPEIEMPGHSRAALAAYPEFSCTGQLQPPPGLWGIFDDIYCSKIESIDFMKDILSEVLELFPSKYIHIGGDEAPKVRWNKCNDCQKVIKNNNLKDEHELQSYYIHQMDDFLSSRGRKLIGWDEILEGGLSPNAAVMSWRGEEGGIEAAKQGHFVVMSPTTYCYFDYYQSPHDSEPLAIGGYLPLEKVYKYDPIPSELTKEQGEFILGGQANLWTEYMPTIEHVEYMTFPRALALIQSLWCVNKPNYEIFLKTYLDYHESYLTLHGTHFSKSIHYPTMIIERAKEGIQVGFKGINKDVVFQVKNYPSGLSRMASYKDFKSDDRIYLDRETSANIYCEIKAEGFEGTLNYIFYMNNDLGRKIDLVTPPHPKYDHNGSLNLVDGIRRSKEFKGSEWLGFTNDEVVMIVDMEEEKDIDGVYIGLLENNGSWIYLPKTITIEVSSNKKDWKRVSSKALKECESNGEMYLTNCDANARYIRITLKSIGVIPEGLGGAGNAPWTFIDEIEILEAKEWR